MRFGDHIVKPLHEAQIEATALEFRNLWRKIVDADYFTMEDFIKKLLQRRQLRGERLQIRFLEKDADGPKARVSYNPLTLHTKVDLWQAVRNDEPWARYVMGHECGHLILHDHFAKGFSDPENRRLPMDQKERSAEWQADRFADYLLMPTELVERQSSPHDLAIRCGVELHLAEERMTQVINNWTRLGKKHEYQCDRCFSFETRRIQARVRCDTCGKISSIQL